MHRRKKSGGMKVVEVKRLKSPKKKAHLKRLFAKPGWSRADLSDCISEAVKRKSYMWSDTLVALAPKG